VAIVGGVYFYWARSTPDDVGDEVPLRPLDRLELEGHVRRVGADVPDDQLALFDADDALETLGERAEGGSPVERAEGVVEAIRARASKRGFVTWPTSTPRDTAIKTAARAWDAMQENGAAARLYSLEVTLVAVAALRSADVDAMVAEVYAFPNDRSPPDPSGHLGYYALAIYPNAPGEGTPAILDPHGGRGTEPEEDDFRVLDDLAVLGAFLNHRAMHALVHEGEGDQAFDLSESALKLDRRSPSIRSARGAILLASGGEQQGLEELEAAAQLRRDAPRLNNLAGLALAQQDYETATRQVAQALEQHPDFAGGHATRAALHLAEGETDLGRRELETAQGLDAELPILPMLWANYYLATHETERAAESAAEAIERQPHSWHARLQAAAVFRAAARYDDMRRQARAIMEMVGPDQREMTRQLIERVLGPTALEEPLDDEPLGDEELPADGLPSADFQLEGGGLLGGGGEGAGPSLGVTGEEGPLPNPGDPSTLRLGGGEGSGLQLDIEE
jgi:tetratricopeptide (TPR) repeat protein